MTTSPARAGIATASAVSMSGAARVSVFCHENQSPNAPLNSSAQACSGLLPPAATKAPNSSSAPAIASTGSASASIASLRRSVSLMACRSDPAHDPFDQVVHAFELGVGLLERLARGDHRLAGLVLQARRPAREDVEGARDDRGLHVVGLLARRR